VFVFSVFFFRFVFFLCFFFTTVLVYFHPRLLNPAVKNCNILILNKFYSTAEIRGKNWVLIKLHRCQAKVKVAHTFTRTSTNQNQLWLVRFTAPDQPSVAGRGQCQYACASSNHHSPDGRTATHAKQSALRSPPGRGGEAREGAVTKGGKGDIQRSVSLSLSANDYDLSMTCSGAV